RRFIFQTKGNVMSSRLPKTSLRDTNSHEGGARLHSRRLRVLLLATSALASVGLTTGAHAFEATWQGGQDGDLHNNSNWSGDIRPDNGTATFGQSNRTSITSNSSWNVGTFQFTAGSSNYDFTIATGVLGFTGDGIVTQPGSGAVQFTVGSAALDFMGSSKAANATITNS